MTSYAFADLITFTRSTTATYVNSSGNITSAAINTHRINHDPATLAVKGFRVEEQRTNLITYSEEIDNAAWTKNAVTVTANAAISPDGTTDADKIIPNTTNTVHGAYRTQTYGAGTFTFSFYAKADGYPRVGVRSYDGAAYFLRATFDVSAGTVVSTQNGTATIEPAGNGWYRCVVTATTAGNMGATVGTWIEPLPAGQTVQASYAGDGTSGTLVWGVQNEVGSFVSSYIPTVASQVTRAADQAVIQSPNFSTWYNQSEGTFIVEYDLILATYGTTKHLATASDGTGSNRVSVYNTATTATPFLIVTDAGVTQASAANSAVGSGVTIKTGVAYKANDFAIITNGGSAATDTSGTVPSTLNRFYIGGSATGAQPVNGHIRSIKYYPSRLTNAQIQGLTA